MIITVSRRTDIPAFFSEWFFNRLRSEYVLVRNPMNFHMVSRIPLTREYLDGIVFFTKNPEPMMKNLSQLTGFPYYFQFTITPYHEDVENFTAQKKEKILTVFRHLSERIGPEKVIWRYDPILLNERYTMEYHLSNFEAMAAALSGYTEKCVMSFLDFYPKIQKRIMTLDIIKPNDGEKRLLAKNLYKIAAHFSIKLEACAEKLDFNDLGISRAKCVDENLLKRIGGYELLVQKNKNQRANCQCAESIDIGFYNTCGHFCRYCYANFNEEIVRKNLKMYDPDAPLLCSQITIQDRFYDRKVKSDRSAQTSFTDLL